MLTRQLVLACAVGVALARTPATSVPAMGSRGQSTSTNDSPTTSRFERLVHEVRSKRFAAGAAGLALGWASTPKMTARDTGNVATAEAWRRRVMSRRPVPLVDRAPRILTVSLACFTVAEYSTLMETYTAREAIGHTTCIRVGREAIEHVNVRLKVFIDPVRIRAERWWSRICRQLGDSQTNRRC